MIEAGIPLNALSSSLSQGADVSFTELFRQNECWRSVALTKPRLFRKGHKFYDNLPEMYFLVSGRVRLMVLAPDGSEKSLWYLGDGSCFNETPMFMDGDKNIPSGQGEVRFFHDCSEDCYICTFTREDVHRLGMQHPELLFNLCKSYSVKVTLLSKNAVSLCMESQLTRICKFLASRIVPGSEPLRAKRDISYRDMADLLGMHRITLYKVMRQAQERGLFSFDKNSDEIFILKPDEFYKEAHM